MAFKLTYSDGNETDYDDNTKWEVENGVVKLGREEGKWTVFVSPSHWATLELVPKDKGDGEGDGEEEDQDKDKDEDEDEDEDKDS
ncbi:MAG: hypothetical protein JOZ23_05620 [Mycobacterium sp.]|nr:hypothetical protein [Mycobacterium sp.]